MDATPLYIEKLSKALYPNAKWYIENPRGKLKTTVWYCKYGDTRAKPTDLD